MHGNTSAVVVETLAQLGYKDIGELRGGMAASVESGRTLKAASGCVTCGRAKATEA